MDWNKFGKVNVLIVEDDMFNRLLLVSLFSKNEHINVIQSENGVEALEKLSVNNVDAILLDIHMPKMNGFEMMKQLNSTSSTSNIPVMVLSSDELERKQSLELGAREFIPKPFNIKTLESQLYDVLERE